MPSFFSKLSVFIRRIEHMPVGWRGIFILAGLIISVRVIVEGIFDSRTVFSYWTAIFWESWYFSLFISFIFLISWVARTPRIKVARLLLAGLPVIFLPLLGLLAGSPRCFFVSLFVFFQTRFRWTIALGRFWILRHSCFVRASRKIFSRFSHLKCFAYKS